MKKYTYLLKHVFFRRFIIVGTSIILFFIFNMLLFTLSRSIISTKEGIQYFEGISNKDVMIANLDPETSYDDIDAIDEDAVEGVVDYMDENLNYGLQFQGIPNGIELNGAPLQYNLYDPLTYQYQSLPIENGRDFKNSDFDNQTVQPVLVGWTLGQTYPVGSTFESLNPFTLEAENYQVVGTLEKNAFVPNYYLVDSKNYLNHTIIYPMPSKRLANLDKAFVIEGLLNLFIAQASSKDLSSFQALLLDQLGIKLNFYSQKENIDDFMNEYKSSINQMAIVLVVVLIAMMSLIVWHAYSSIKIMLKEITVHILVGLNYKDLSVSLYLFQAILFTTSTVGIFLFALAQRMQIASMAASDFITVNTLGLLPMDWYGLMLVLLTNIIISAVIVQIIMWRIKKIPFSIGVLS